MMKRTLRIAFLILFSLNMLQVSILNAAEKKESISSALSSGTNVEGQASAAAGAEEAMSITFSDIMARGGWIMYVISGLSLVAIALALFYCMTMRASILFPNKFIDQAKDLADANNLEELQDLCATDASPAAKIISATLEQIVPGHPLDYNRLRDAMEDEGGRQAGILWQRLQYLMDIAVISPMVGLLGTVWGMMVSFGGIENGADFAKKAETLANGISQAMYTTFGGLIVGIFAMALYDLARGHLNKLIGQLESACGGILRRIASAGTNK
ncbi:MAG: MotA/TolQ/ExbB proton channel family protein [Victivallales bacterium]|nr:MotA/TolQ/ExbB proton channel family protein [Victivallales bacterium]